MFGKAIGVLCLALMPLAAWAQNSTLKGKVFDKNSKEGLIGASVAIVGTYKGAATDFNGDFLITDIKPGDYSVKVTYIGYNEKVYTGIRFKAGETTTLNIDMAELGQTLDQVVIIGEKNLVDLESGKTEAKVTAADIKEMNVRDVQQIVAMQSGVNLTPDGLSIRGGRVYETQYVVDGISAQDPLSGTGFGVDVASGSVQEVSVITGGAGAEYGDGTSGVVVTKIKEGGDKLQVTGSWQRDNLGTRVNQGPSWNTDIAEIAIGGPVPFTSKKLTFFTSANMMLTDNYFRLYADQLRSSIMPDQTFWAPRQDNKFSHTFKIGYNIRPGTKVTLTNQHSIGINQNTRTLQIVGFDQIMAPGLQYRFALDLDAATTYTHRSNLTAFNLKHFFAERWSVDVSLGRLFTNLRADANGRPFRTETVDQIYDPASIVSNPIQVFNPDDQVVFVLPGPGFVNNGGISTLWHDHYAEEYTYKTKFIRASRNNKNFLTFGVEHKEQAYQWIDVTRPWIGAPIKISETESTPAISIGSSNDIWAAKPATGGFFVEDEIRYNGIIAFIGARFNYWAPGTFVDNAIADPNAPVLDQIRENYMNQTVGFAGRRFKARLLPKLRVSFPVTENVVMYFNYGHSMRLPHPRFVYAGLDPVFQDRSFLSNLGNPNLNPEVTVAYEMGLKAQITRDLAVTTSAFYNDKFDYIVNRTIIVQDRTGRFVEKAFSINQDYARIYGVEVGLSQRLGKMLRSNVNVAYQQARGKSNTAAESLLQIKEMGFVNTTREQFLAWDRPWDLKGSLIFKPDESIGFGKYNLNHFRFFISSTWKSGLRYTPHVLTGQEPNGRPRWESLDNQPLSAIGAPWFWTDLKVSRDIRLMKGKALSFSFEARNVFNNKIAQLINPVTGRAYEDGDPLPIGSRDPRYADPQDNGLMPYNPARFMAPRQLLWGVSFNF
jgi:outer membrane receptor protein involved in Fe transport